MKYAWLALLLIGAACSSAPANDELAALEESRASLDPDVYADKKAALESLAPLQEELRKARESGAISEQDFAARKARLSERALTLEALEKGLRLGVLTRGDYRSQKATLLIPEPLTETTAKPETAAASNGKTPAEAYRMKLVQVVDRTGFEKPIPSASLLIPADWRSQGATQWNIRDFCNTVSTSFKAEGPDGRAFEVFPEFNWKWADDTTALKMDFAQKLQMGSRACDVMPPMSAADYLRKNLGRARPNAQTVSVEPMPKALAGLQQQARAAEQQAAQYGLREQIKPDLVRAKLRYGNAEEWIIVKTVTIGIAGPFGTSYSSNASAIAERAPAGQLESSEKLFDLIISTIRVNPEWQRRMTNNAQTMQQIELQGVRDRSAIISKNADEIRNIQRQGYESQQASQDRIYAQYSETVRGVETYRNPTSGETIELSNQYGNAWVNNRGEYLLSDQPGFDPNVALRENWTALEHVRR